MLFSMKCFLTIKTCYLTHPLASQVCNWSPSFRFDFFTYFLLYRFWFRVVRFDLMHCNAKILFCFQRYATISSCLTKSATLRYEKNFVQIFDKGKCWGRYIRNPHRNGDFFWKSFNNFFCLKNNVGADATIL